VGREELTALFFTPRAHFRGRVGPRCHGRQEGLRDAAMAVLCQRAQDLGRSPRAGAVDEAWRALGGKALDPLAPGARGKGPRV
jgi:hypothetical protein